MKNSIILFCLLLPCIGFSQNELCTLCESLEMINKKEFNKKCYQRDSSSVDGSNYEIRKKHLCKELLYVSYYTENDTVPTVSYQVENGKDSVYMRSEKQPEFNGGTEAYIKFLQTNLFYPKKAESKRIQGRVVVSFMISKTGEVYNAKIHKGVESSLDEEALRVINAMPKWIPGEHKGQPVAYRFTAPIKFKLPK